MRSRQELFQKAKELAGLAMEHERRKYAFESICSLFYAAGTSIKGPILSNILGEEPPDDIYKMISTWCELAGTMGDSLNTEKYVSEVLQATPLPRHTPAQLHGVIAAYQIGILEANERGPDEVPLTVVIALLTGVEAILWSMGQIEEMPVSHAAVTGGAVAEQDGAHLGKLAKQFTEQVMQLKDKGDN